MFANESEAYASASVVPIHTRSELSSDSDSAYDSASVVSVASVNQPFTHGAPRSSQELVQKCPCIPESNWNLEMLVFKERGKPQYPEKNLSEQIREPTTNRLNPHTTPCSGFEPGPHWWEASALTTALTLLP